MPVGLVPGLTKSHLEGSVFRYVQGDAGAEADGILPRGAGDEARGTG